MALPETIPLSAVGGSGLPDTLPLDAAGVSPAPEPASPFWSMNYGTGAGDTLGNTLAGIGYGGLKGFGILGDVGDWGLGLAGADVDMGGAYRSLVRNLVGASIGQDPEDILKASAAARYGQLPASFISENIALGPVGKAFGGLRHALAPGLAKLGAIGSGFKEGHRLTAPLRWLGGKTVSPLTTVASKIPAAGLGLGEFLLSPVKGEIPAAIGAGLAAQLGEEEGVNDLGQIALALMGGASPGAITTGKRLVTNPIKWLASLHGEQAVRRGAGEQILGIQSVQPNVFTKTPEARIKGIIGEIGAKYGDEAATAGRSYSDTQQLSGSETFDPAVISTIWKKVLRQFGPDAGAAPKSVRDIITPAGTAPVQGRTPGLAMYAGLNQPPGRQLDWKTFDNMYQNIGRTINATSKTNPKRKKALTKLLKQVEAYERMVFTKPVADAARATREGWGQAVNKFRTPIMRKLPRKSYTVKSFVNDITANMDNAQQFSDVAGTIPGLRDEAQGAIMQHLISMGQAKRGDWISDRYGMLLKIFDDKEKLNTIYKWSVAGPGSMGEWARTQAFKQVNYKVANAVSSSIRAIATGGLAMVPLVGKGLAGIIAAPVAGVSAGAGSGMVTRLLAPFFRNVKEEDHLLKQMLYRIDEVVDLTDAATAANKNRAIMSLLEGVKDGTLFAGLEATEEGRTPGELGIDLVPEAQAEEPEGELLTAEKGTRADIPGGYTPASSPLEGWRDFMSGEEGGVSKDKRDPGNKGGNVTNRGITQGYYDKYREAQGLKPKKLPRDKLLPDREHKQIAEWHWKKVARVEGLPRKVAEAMADMYFMSSPKGAILPAQEALNDIGVKVKTDGKRGPETMGALRALKGRKVDAFIEALVKRRLNYLRKLDAWKTYKNGWTKRTEGYKDF